MPTARALCCTLAGCLILTLLASCGQGGDGRLSTADFSASAGEETSAVAAESHARSTRRAAQASPAESERNDSEDAADASQSAAADGADDELAAEDDSAAPAVPDAVNPEPTVAGLEGDSMFVDAMVGQINGKPVYASSIFQAIGDDVLRQLGRNTSRLGFRRQVEQLIQGEVERRVIDALILAEAEKDLGEEQHRQLLAYMEKEREQILAQHLGSKALAERALQEEFGRSLEEELEIRRQRALIDRYRHEKLRPQVVVTRRDVERYYRDNYDQYHQSASVEVEIIFVQDQTTAEQIDSTLASGTAFDDLNQRSSTITGSGSLAEFEAVRWEALNEAIRELEVGEHTPRIEVEGGYAWARLVSIEGGESQSIKDVFLDIERRLQANQANQLWRRHIMEMRAEGNFTPVDQMTRALLEVAMSRYAAPG